MMKLALLPGRRVLELTGADRVGFLNGLVSNDVTQAAPGRAVWAALLTPQGKYLADFFILAEAERLLLACASSQAPLVSTRLLRYRLRADVAIAPVPLAVHAAWDGTPDVPDSIAAPDPRLPDAGWLVFSAAPLACTASAEDFDVHRLSLGLPDGVQDLEPEKSVLLEAGFGELGGVSWTKGCYMGQELTARTRYRGLLKRRLLPVQGESLPPHGTPVAAGDRVVGEMRSSRGGVGLALLRLDALEQPLHAGGHALSLRIPAWVRLPQPA
jgi:folate-binding protein YgfZ